MTYSNVAFAEYYYRSPANSTHELEGTSMSLSYTESRRSRSLAIEELLSVFSECSYDNWDGYGASAVLKASKETAIEFLNALPRFIDNPEISADSDGEISLEWYKGPDITLSISVSSNRRLSYAGVFESSKVHGIENFGLQIPITILKYLFNHFSNLQ